jgi:putative membrane protein
MSPFISVRKSASLITLALLSAGSLALAQSAEKEKPNQPAPEPKPAASAPAPAPAPARPTSPNVNENFPSNPNVNPTPGQKYNAKGVANSSGESGAGKSSLERADQIFLTETFEHTAEQYKIAKLAASKAANAELKAFAEKRVKAYELLSQNLDAINKDKHMGLIEPKSEHAFDSLNKKTGAKFDEAYLKYDRAEMKSAIERAQKTAEKGKDDAVKALAAKLVPQYQENERFASELELALKRK